MNWMGGNLVKFKRKATNRNSKAQERIRIEDYIRQRQAKSGNPGPSSSSRPIIDIRNNIHRRGSQGKPSLNNNVSMVVKSFRQDLTDGGNDNNNNPILDGIDLSQFVPKNFPPYLRQVQEIYNSLFSGEMFLKKGNSKGAFEDRDDKEEEEDRMEDDNVDVDMYGDYVPDMLDPIDEDGDNEEIFIPSPTSPRPGPANPHRQQSEPFDGNFRSQGPVSLNHSFQPTQFNHRQIKRSYSAIFLAPRTPSTLHDISSIKKAKDASPNIVNITSRLNSTNISINRGSERVNGGGGSQNRSMDQSVRSHHDLSHDRSHNRSHLSNNHNQSRQQSQQQHQQKPRKKVKPIWSIEDEDEEEQFIIFEPSGSSEEYY